MKAKNAVVLGTLALSGAALWVGITPDPEPVSVVSPLRPFVAQAQAPAPAPFAFMDQGVRLSYTSRSTGDVQRVSAVWGVATDGRLTASGYRAVVELWYSDYHTVPVQQYATVVPSLNLDVRLPDVATDSVRLRVSVFAIDGSGRESKEGVTGARWFKRMPNTTAAVPAIDSFPVDTTMARVAWGDWAYKPTSAEFDRTTLADIRKATTMEDVQLALSKDQARRAMPDSLHSPINFHSTIDTVVAGAVYFQCLLQRNRFTDRVAILKGDPRYCESPRARWDSILTAGRDLNNATGAVKGS